MKTAIYLRISTLDQTHDSQEGQVRGFAERSGWSDLEVYADSISGTAFIRPELERLLADCREGKIERILVYKLDRLGRSILHMTRILEELKRLRIPVFFTSQGHSTENDNPATEMFLNILMCVAQFERSLICERVKAGLAARKAAGKPIGRSQTPDPIKTAVREKRALGMTLRQISSETKVAIGTVHNILKQAN